MDLATILSRAPSGFDALSVTVEVHISRGLPSFSIVGLPETAVKESKDRVRSAIINSGFEFPTNRIAVNLAPADLPKEGGRYDLPIALGVLVASEQLPAETTKNRIFLGELALSGELRSVSGAVVTALSLRHSNYGLFLPDQSAQEAALVGDVSIYAAKSLLGLCETLISDQLQTIPVEAFRADHSIGADVKDVVGQSLAKKALEIAAAGNHSLLMMGTPGSGKTMLANRLPGILPGLSKSEALENLAIRSLVVKQVELNNWKSRPFRSPHHSASYASLIGGGTNPRPGEITLAHNGILFLDELTEFGKQTLDSLREPLENGYVDISRASGQFRFPARFTLVAAANPCSCGYFGDISGLCQCSSEQIARYRAKLSGPLRDRIDIQIFVSPVKYADLQGESQSNGEESSETIRQRVIRCRAVQISRQGCLNSELKESSIQQFCGLGTKENNRLEQVFNKLNLSARGYHKILKLSRTIADMHDSRKIEMNHLSLAITCRQLDRK